MEAINIMASLTADDKVLIRILRTKKPFNAYQMIAEFPSRKWKKWALYRLIETKIDATGLSNRTKGGGRKRSAGAADNIVRVLGQNGRGQNGTDKMVRTKLHR